MADESFLFPADVLTEILMLLPPSCRRRLRLVCKLRRDVVDERTPERQVRSKVLAFVSNGFSSRALVFDNHDGSRRREWTFQSSGGYAGVVHMVGTCNGLLCLHETAPFGDRGVSVLTVANPVTGETRVLPPMMPARRRPDQPTTSLGLYVFGYHPTTGRYKVVHIPPSSSRAAPWFGAVQVLDLGGEPAWREVAAPGGASCHISCGAVCVEGSVYWLTARADGVVALDLEDERVACLDAPPAVRPAKAPSRAACRLTNVQARLGVAVARDEPEAAAAVVDVWVLEGGERRRWSRRYSVVEPRCADWTGWVTAPHFTHGEYVLCVSSSGKRRLYRRKVGKDDGARLGPSELIMSQAFYGGLTTFPYVETQEPLPSVCG